MRPRPIVYIGIAAKISAARRRVSARALALPPRERAALLARFQQTLAELDGRVARALLLGLVTKDEALAVHALARPLHAG